MPEKTQDMGFPGAWLVSQEGDGFSLWCQKSCPDLLTYVIKQVPEETIHLKKLFGQKQMDACSISAPVLYQIAKKLLHTMEVLKAYEAAGIFPGLWDLEDIHYNLADGKVYILHPERFQLGEKEQDYEWFPEDENLFGDLVYFDSQSQDLANERLLYKVIVAAAKGNVKIPPAANKMDYSEQMYKELPAGIRYHLLSGEVWNLTQWKAYLPKEDSNEEEASVQNRSDREAAFLKPEEEEEAAEGNEEKIGKETPKANREAEASGWQECYYNMYLLLQGDLHSALSISRLLYECMDEEESLRPKDARCKQAFLYGDQAIHVRDFQEDPRGFRIQMKSPVRYYSMGELLLLAADYLDELVEGLEAEGEKIVKTNHVKVYLLADNRLANDRLFQYALKRLRALKEKGVVYQVERAREAMGEAIERLIHDLTEA